MNESDIEDFDSPQITVNVEDINEAYDFIIKELLGYSDEQIDSFDVYESEDYTEVKLFGPDEVLERRVDNLYDRIQDVGKAQSTLESVRVEYIVEDSISENRLFAVVRTMSEPVEFILDLD